VQKRGEGHRQHANQAMHPNCIVRPVKLRLPTDPARLLEIVKGGFDMLRVSVGGNDLGGGPVIVVRNEDRFSLMLLAPSVEVFMVDGVGKRRRLGIGDDLSGDPLPNRRARLGHGPGNPLPQRGDRRSPLGFFPFLMNRLQALLELPQANQFSLALP